MRRPKRKDLVQRGVEGSGERVGLVLGRKVVGQRLKSMKIWSVMVVSSGGEASEGGGGVVVVRESEMVERRREQRVIMGLRWRGGGGWWWERRSWGWGVKERAMMVE
ncbi:hypothetical protein CMV_026270 [Castanea mollissima]|uniref:Uncharacterized protein n=1 Tax=Castanea mollissima TaxID=60419 RepID=A0A8J4VG09_9ROSI|nr:hypothetical protein CMV_026270 [Castanea mollissima]